MKKFIKNITILYLIYSIVFFSNLAFALGGGWTKTSTSRSGASSTYNGSRSYNPNYGGSSSINSTATLVPLATEVTSWVLRGTAWGAVATAAGLLYQGYQWAEDFQNNRIKGTPPENPNSSQYCYFREQYTACGLSQLQSTSPAYFASYYGVTAVSITNVTVNSSNVVIQYSYQGGSLSMTFGVSLNQNYNPNAPAPTPVYIPLDTVSQKIIEMANAGNLEAQAVTNAVNDEAWSDNPLSTAQQARLLNQLNKNAVHPSDTQSSSTTTGLASSTNPNASGTTTTTSTTETQTELPAFCKYASKLCDWLDWSQELPENDEKKPVEIKQQDITFTQTAYINVSGSCPPPASISFGVLGNLSIDFSMFCNVLSIIRPAVISASFLSAIFIVMGVRNE